MYPTINSAHTDTTAAERVEAGLVSSIRLRGAGTSLLACMILTAVAGGVQASPPATAAESESPAAEKAEVQALRQELAKQGTILQKLVAQQAASLPPQAQPSADPTLQTQRPADEADNTQPVASPATPPSKEDVTAKKSADKEPVPGDASDISSPATSPAHSGVNPVSTTTQNEMIPSTSSSVTQPAEAENAAAHSVSSTDQISIQDESGRRAYASGVSLAYDMKQSLAQQKSLGITLPASLLMAGLQDALSGRPLRMADQDIQSTLSALNSDFSTRLQERRAEEVARGRAFRTEFRRIKGTVSDAGSLYLIDKKGSGRLRTSDMATLLITGRLPDGTVFEGSGEAGQASKVKVGAMLPAIAIGLQMVGAGGHLTVVVPPEKGYGDMGLPPSIPGGATLIFDITVKGVNDAS